MKIISIEFLAESLKPISFRLASFAFILSVSVLSGCGGGSVSDVADSDGDGLSDVLEKSLGTSAVLSDSDRDGLSDYDEVKVYGTNPMKSDTDDDGLTDKQEVIQFLTNPLLADTDSDGLSDKAEISSDPRTDSLDSDTDDDGINDGDEVNTYGTNPTSLDTDLDTLRDYVEIFNLGTNPLSSDSDADTYPDADEVNADTDPMNYYSNLTEDAKLRFALPVDLSKSDGHAYAPSVVVDSDGNPHAAFHDNVEGGMEIFYVHSDDRGETFSTALNVSNSPGIAEFAKIAVDAAGTVYIIYKDNVDGTANVFFVKKDAGSDSFDPPLNLTRGAVITAAPDIVVDSTGRVVVIWYTAGAVVISAATDGGYLVDSNGDYILDVDGHMQSSFIELGRFVADDSPTTTAITVNDDDDEIHAVFGKAAEYGVQVHYVRSFDGIFSAESTQVSFAEGGTAGSKIAVDGSYVYISWTAYPLDQKEDISLARSKDGGATFEAVVSVSDSASEKASTSVFSDLAVMRDGTLVAIWQDTFAGNYETVVSRSFDHGLTFEEPYNFNPSEEGSLVSSIAINDDSQIFIAVDDNRFGPFEAIMSRGQVGLPAVAAASVTEDVLTIGVNSTESTTLNAYSTVPLYWTVKLYKKDETEKVLGRVDRKVRDFVSQPSDFSVDFSADWDGTVDAGSITGELDGAYYFLVTGLTADGVEAAEKRVNLTVVLSANASVLEFSEYLSSQKAFAPDGDGRQEIIWFSGNYNRQVDWSLVIKDSLNNEIYRDSGEGRSLFVEWNGINDAGLLMGEGNYTATATGVDSEGNEITETLDFGIDLTSPTLDGLTFSPTTIDGAGEVMDIDFSISEGAVVTLYIYQGESQLVSELHRLSYPNNEDGSPINIHLEWDGTTGDEGGNYVDPGTYTVRIWCRDFAANRVIEYPMVREICVGACSE